MRFGVRDLAGLLGRRCAAVIASAPVTMLALKSLQSPVVAGCAPIDEAEHMTALLQLVSWPTTRLADMERRGVGTIVELMSFSNGALKLDPPDGTVQHALLQSFVAGSTLGGADAWTVALDAHAGAAAGAAAYAANQAATSQQATRWSMLLGFAKDQLPASTRRAIASAGLPGGSGLDSVRRTQNEGDRKEPRMKQDSLRGAAERMYNQEIPLSVVDPRTTVDSHISFKDSQLTVAALSSGKYGALISVQSEDTVFKPDESGVLTEDHTAQRRVHLSRNGLVLGAIRTYVNSLAAAGNVAIDPTVSFLAGSTGKIYRGEAGEKQIQFDMTSANNVVNCFTALSSVLSPSELVARFDKGTEGHAHVEALMPEVGVLMTTGHSACSAVKHAIETLPWLKPGYYSNPSFSGGNGGGSTPRAPRSGDLDNDPGSGRGGSSGTASSNNSSHRPGKKGTLVNKDTGDVEFISKAAHAKQMAHLERQLADTRAAKEKAARGRQNYRTDDSPRVGGGGGGGGGGGQARQYEGGDKRDRQL